MPRYDLGQFRTEIFNDFKITLTFYSEAQLYPQRIFCMVKTLSKTNKFVTFLKKIIVSEIFISGYEFCRTLQFYNAMVPFPTNSLPLRPALT